MKFIINRLLLSIGLLVLLSSCVVSYQVYYMQPEKALGVDRLVYENKYIKVGYVLWCEGGNSGFAVYNKTNKPIYVDLENSHFVLNDIAHTYFQNSSHTSGTLVRTTNTSVWGSGTTNMKRHKNAFV